MRFSFLSEVFQRLEKTSSRLELTDIVSDFLDKAPPEHLPTIVLFLMGRVFPPWSDKEIGIADKIMVKAISKVSGETEARIFDVIRETGDPGLAAEKVTVKKSQTTLFTQQLTVEKVYENLAKLAELTGKGSQEKKLSYISELLSFSSPLDAKYITRLILGDLRLGVGEGTVRDAIAKTFSIPKESVEKAYYLTSDLGEVAMLAKKKGEEGLNDISIEVGRPIKVMLALKEDSIEKAVEETGKAAFEVKYDGARVQIHKSGEIELYTRRLENVTKQFPEIIKLAGESINAESAIVEGEIVAINADRKPMPFQNLSRRIKRKYDIGEMVDRIPVEVNLFDIVYLDGKNLLDEEFQARRKRLESIIKPSERFRLAEQLVTDNVEEAGRFYRQALDAGHEGVMVKILNAPYKAGSRVGYMYKIKPVMETLDLVPVGATWGEGRRASWLGSYLLAARDNDTGDYLTIGRMATGLNDEQLQELTNRLKPSIISQKGKEVTLKPSIVMEVAYEEIQKSPTYESGYALRFPRLVRVRDDKSPEDGDTLERVEEIIG